MLDLLLSILLFVIMVASSWITFPSIKRKSEACSQLTEKGVNAKSLNFIIVALVAFICMSLLVMIIQICNCIWEMQRIADLSLGILMAVSVVIMLVMVVWDLWDAINYARHSHSRMTRRNFLLLIVLAALSVVSISGCAITFAISLADIAQILGST